MVNLAFQKSNIGLGKRKKSIARVFIIPGSGTLIVNNLSGEKYFQHNENYLKKIALPLEKVLLFDKKDVIAIVKGGGLNSQADAIQLGISRLLCKLERKYRSQLKPHNFLTRDSRIKERKKYGLKKARKAPQYSKR